MVTSVIIIRRVSWSGLATLVWFFTAKSYSHLGSKFWMKVKVVKWCCIKWGYNNFVRGKVPTRARMGRAILPPSLSLNWTLCFERGEGVPLDGQLACLWAPTLNDGKVFFVGFNKVNNWHWHCIWDTDHTTEKTFYSSLSRFQPSAEYHTWSHFVFCVVPLWSVIAWR